MSRDDASLLDIAKAARQIALFLVNVSEVDFISDAKTQSAVLYQLLVIGEAVKRLSDRFRNHHTAIPWSLIAGMRDHLIHAYDTVDWDEVWRTATVDVAHPLDEIIPLLPRNTDQGRKS